MQGIEIRELVKRYPRSTDLLHFLRNPLRREEVTALRGVNLSLAPGRIYGLVGPNGAGKTTLLKILAGVVWPTSGEALIDGLDASRGDRSLRERVGLVVADERSFFWRLTARENLRFFAVLQRIPGRSLEVRVTECLARFGLDDAGDRPFRALSTGMRQRLAIARGMILDPPVLLLDEATRSLDPAAAREVRARVREAARGCSEGLVIYSTHILSEIEELCDEVLVLRHGRIVHREELRRVAGGALRYRLRTRVTPGTDLLAGLPGVVLLHGTEHTLDLEVTGEEALQPLVRRVQERSLGLVELRPIERSLDDLLAESEGA